MHTNSSTPELHLSLEEVVVLLNLMGHTLLARETLHAITGHISVDEERGRLLAANCSLLASGAFQPTDDGMQIDPANTRLLAPLADNRFVVRCAAREPGRPEDVVMFYVQDDLVVEQRIEYEVAHTLREVTAADASATCRSLLDLDRPATFQATAFNLTDEQLEEARRLTVDGTEEAGNFLRGPELDDNTIALFVDDLFHQRRRGSVVRLEIDTNAETVRDSGFLWLRGQSGRGWLLTHETSAGDPMVYVRPANTRLVRQSLAAAFAPRSTV